MVVAGDNCVRVADKRRFNEFVVVRIGRNATAIPRKRNES
jgi:hypothetical protein